MAQKYIVQLVDDLTGEEIENGSGDSVSFALDGVTYVIDLSATNADALREALAPYVDAARKADGPSKPRPAAKTATPKSDLKAIRDWATSHGLHVSSRGRISAEVQQAYAAAH